MRSVLRMAIILGVAWAPLAWAGTLAQFRTVLGEVDVELFDFDKPATVQNFKSYVESGAYENTFFSRWVTNFVVQGGGFKVVAVGTNLAFGLVPISEAITNEYSIGKHFSNLYGTIAMARQQGVTNSATSQFFFNVKDNDFLDSVDGGFTVFGQVVGGTNVLNLFQAPAGTNGVFFAQPVCLNPPLCTVVLDALPVLSTTPGFRDLIYVDITLLRVQVSPSASGEEISWLSVSNRVNRVQFTTNLPPVWQELVRTNGTGDRLRVLDAAAAPTGRFYRVVVDF